VFGEYAFEVPLEVGSRLVFRGVGAYALVKAHMFNGVNLPAVYAVSANGEMTLKKRFTFADFAARCGANENAAV
jgi:carboxynorspermidine decarboxylase